MGNIVSPLELYCEGVTCETVVFNTSNERARPLESLLKTACPAAVTDLHWPLSLLRGPWSRQPPWVVSRFNEI